MTEPQDKLHASSIDDSSHKGNILIMAGGTGGHVFPALTVAAELLSRGYSIYWLGTKKGIESRLVPEAGFPIHYLAVAGLRGKGLRSLLYAPVKLTASLFSAVKFIRSIKPVAVLGMGGFASGPGGVAAWLLRRPLLIHEQNSVAGTTNRMLACIAKIILCGYPNAFRNNQAQFVGNPVRSEILLLSQQDLRISDEEQPLRLLILGGSLGAKPLNDAMIESLSQIKTACRVTVWHQCGNAHSDSVIAWYRAHFPDERVEAFIDDMVAAYDWADIVLCRAGALTVSELTAAGVASILVPLPHAIDDHQLLNARWIADQGGAELLEQSQLSTERLLDRICHFSQDRIALKTMAHKARQLAKIDATLQVADVCQEVAFG